MNRAVPEQLLDTSNSEVISTYDSLLAAHHAVDVLADAGYDVRELAIVGHGLTTVERIAGKLSYGRVAISGAFSGIYFGAGISLVAVLAGFVQSGNMLNTLLACMLIGVGIGVLLAVANHAMNRNRRSFTSFGGMRAARYDLKAPRGQIAAARQILAEHAVQQH